MLAEEHWGAWHPTDERGNPTDDLITGNVAPGRVTMDPDQTHRRPRAREERRDGEHLGADRGPRRTHEDR